MSAQLDSQPLIFADSNLKICVNYPWKEELSFATSIGILKQELERDRGLATMLVRIIGDAFSQSDDRVAGMLVEPFAPVGWRLPSWEPKWLEQELAVNFLH